MRKQSGLLDSADLLLHEAFHDWVNMETEEGAMRDNSCQGPIQYKYWSFLESSLRYLMQHGKRIDVEEHKYAA